MAFVAPALGAVGGGSALAGLGTVLGAAGSLYSGFAQMQAAKTNAEINRVNAEIAEENARDAIQQSQLEAQETDARAKMELGALLADQGASGLGLSSGSFALQRKSATELAAKDRGYIRAQGNIDAAKYRQQAVDFRNQARVSRAEGQNAFVGSVIGAGSSLVSGATRNRRAAAIDIRAGRT